MFSLFFYCFVVPLRHSGKGARRGRWPPRRGHCQPPLGASRAPELQPQHICAPAPRFMAPIKTDSGHKEGRGGKKKKQQKPKKNNTLVWGGARQLAPCAAASGTVSRRTRGAMGSGLSPTSPPAPYWPHCWEGAGGGDLFAPPPPCPAVPPQAGIFPASCLPRCELGASHRCALQGLDAEPPATGHCCRHRERLGRG